MSQKLEAIAATLGLDYESERQFRNEYQYQPTRTQKTIFTDGRDYYSLSNTQPIDKVGGPWTRHEEQFWAARAGSVLWVSLQEGKD